MQAMNRRHLLTAAAALAAPFATRAQSDPNAPPPLNVRHFGARGDGVTIDTPAFNRAIEAAAAQGGGVVHIPAGVYACYTIRMKSLVTLDLDPGATILAASTPLEGTATGGYDAAEPQGPWEPYQDYGHNHWANSLIWGEGLHDIAIVGGGLIWGKGLSRGHSDDKDLPDTTKPGVGNKAIALKNCHNVLLRDFRVLQGGWFALLATGVDNLTIANLLVDTNRDGFDIDCCRNVRVIGCTVNSPWDDGICPKSSFALGYDRSTENVTISDCFVTGDYQLGSVLDGTWKPMPPGFAPYGTGRIKCGIQRRVQEHHHQQLRAAELARPVSGDGGRRPYRGRDHHRRDPARGVEFAAVPAPGTAHARTGGGSRRGAQAGDHQWSDQLRRRPAALDHRRRARPSG